MRTRAGAFCVAILLMAGCANENPVSSDDQGSVEASSGQVLDATPEPEATWPEGLTPPGSVLEVGEWATFRDGGSDEQPNRARVRVAWAERDPAFPNRYIAAIEWESVVGAPEPPRESEEMLGLKWVRRTPGFLVGREFAEARPSEGCPPEFTNRTPVSRCVWVFTEDSTVGEETTDFSFRLTLGGVADLNRQVFWTSPMWQVEPDVSTEDVCKPVVFYESAGQLDYNPTVEFCDGQWALAKSAAVEEGDATAVVFRRLESGVWQFYTTFPTEFCVDEFRSAGGPQELEEYFPPCQ
jgi:hypothetical protein